MVTLPDASSFLLAAVNARLEDSSFKTGSEVAACAHEAAEALRDWCEDKANDVPYAHFSRLLLRELEGTLPTNGALNRENIWRLFFKMRSSIHCGDRFYSR